MDIYDLKPSPLAVPHLARAVVSADTVRQAASFRREAVEQLLVAHHPTVYRLALALCGDEATGAGVVRVIAAQSLHAMDRWKTPADVSNWFLHHTVLVARQEVHRRTPPAEDCLARGGAPPLVAFVRALRSLPFQQAEAFILHHGEQLEPRSMAVAMDCSTTAAAKHMVAATSSLRTLSGDGFDRFVAMLAGNYAALVPREGLVVEGVGRTVTRRKTARRIAQAIALIAILALVAAGVWVAWRVYPTLDY